MAHKYLFSSLFSTLLGIYLGVELLGHMVILCLTFGGNTNCFFHCLHHFTPFYKYYNFSHPPQQLFSLFFIIVTLEDPHTLFSACKLKACSMRTAHMLCLVFSLEIWVVVLLRSGGRAGTGLKNVVIGYSFFSSFFTLIFYCSVTVVLQTKC